MQHRFVLVASGQREGEDSLAGRWGVEKWIWPEAAGGRAITRGRAAGDEKLWVTAQLTFRLVVVLQRPVGWT